jgi:hypothetical protein
VQSFFYIYLAGIKVVDRDYCTPQFSNMAKLAIKFLPGRKSQLSLRQLLTFRVRSGGNNRRARGQKSF